MKIAITPLSMDDIITFSKYGADIFVMGNEKYANRLAHSFEHEEIIQASRFIRECNKELYIILNKVVHHTDVEEIDAYLSTLANMHISGIIFGDLAVFMLAKKHGIEKQLIYHPETLNTNNYDTVFWKNKGIRGLTISKEITLDDMLRFKDKAEIELSMIGHGHLNMFHSRRPLIENFFKYKEEEYETLLNNRKLKIVEEIRNESYPILQDIHGTHIFREKAMQAFLEIKKLAEVIDVFIIDGIFKTSEYLVEVLNLYHQILNDEIKQKDILKKIKKYEQNHDTGFLHKKTVYDKF